MIQTPNFNLPLWQENDMVSFTGKTDSVNAAMTKIDSALKSVQSGEITLTNMQIVVGTDGYLTLQQKTTK